VGQYAVLVLRCLDHLQVQAHALLVLRTFMVRLVRLPALGRALVLNMVSVQMMASVYVMKDSLVPIVR
jgi:hypothetical protein